MALGVQGHVVPAGIGEAASEEVQKKLLPGIWGVYYRGVLILALARVPPGCAEGQRPFAGSLRVSLGFSRFVPQEWGIKGVDQTNYGNLRVIPTGQWSDPVTSGMMKALVTEGTRSLVTKK
jgi:hypothetical protein